MNVGQRIPIADGSGIDSGKIATIESPMIVIINGRGVPTNIAGAYKPIDLRHEYVLRMDDGSINSMFRNRCFAI